MRALALAATLAVAACATAPRTEIPADAPISGRLSLKVARTGESPHNLSANFELEGDERSGHLTLSTPLGTGIAQAHWSSSDAVLATSQGQRSYTDLDSLARDALGETVPLAALPSWLRGRPWTGAQSSQLPSQSGTPGFTQLGWQVDYDNRVGRWVIVSKLDDPSSVTLRVKLD
jgi:outer membrane lipoprotein LolB